MDLINLFGVWRLISAQMILTESGEITDLHGANPKGYAIFDRSGRAMIILTASSRTAPGSEEMTAYTGRVRVDGNRLVTSVDVAWLPAWENTDQIRIVELDEDKLTLSSEPSRDTSLLPGVLKVVTVKWERER